MQLKTKVINYAMPGVVKMLQIGALPGGRQLKTKRSSLPGRVATNYVKCCFKGRARALLRSKAKEPEVTERLLLLP